MRRVLRHDDRYHHNVDRLKKIKHLALGLVVAALVATCWIIPVLANTADKGLN
jgi:hypothetical protein